MQEGRKKEGIALVIALVICSIYYIWIFQFYDLYMDRDDAMMRAIASGTYSGTPDGHMIYIKYVYGVFLSLLYTIMPNINWYGICYMGISCVGMALILWKLYRMEKRGVGFKCWLTFVFVSLYTIYVYPILVDNINFTYVAGFCGMTSVFYLVTSETKDEQKRITVDLVISAIFAGMCLLIRQDVFYIIFAIMVFYIAYSCLKDRAHIKGLLRYGVLVVVIALSIFIVEKVAYSSDEWKGFREYDDNRSMMVDYYSWEGYDKYSEIYDKLL